MQHDLVLEGKVVSSSGVLELEVGVSGGRIVEVRKSGLTGSRRIRAGRCLIFPGFVDIHTHLREPGWEGKEDFRTGTVAAVHGGVTTVVDMPNNPSPTTSLEAVMEKGRLARSKAVADVKFYGGVDGADIGKLEGLAPQVVGFKVYLARTTGDGMLPKELLPDTLKAIGRTARPASFHCEDQGIIEAKTKELAGVKRADVHCDIRPPESEAVSVKETLARLAETRVARANVCHVSVSTSVEEVARARAGGMEVYCEATLHHLYFDRKAMLRSPMLKTNPPLRDESDRSELARRFALGEVPFLVTDHAPHRREEKLEMGLSGVPGLDDFGHLVTWLIKKEGVSPEVVARAAAEAPADFLGLQDRGAVSEGRRADFTVVDLDSAERVRAEQVRSKCGWSPYEGHEFPGKVRWTIVEGKVVLDDYELSL